MQDKQNYIHDINDEIFNLSMLLVELNNECVPYKYFDTKQIMNHVTRGGREKIITFDTTNITLRENFINLINNSEYNAHLHNLKTH